MLTKRDIEIVQSDWEKVEPEAETAARLLYDRLFVLDPSARSLFPADITDQRKKLMRMVGAAVYGLANPEILMPLVRFLGRKHVRYGVRDVHYETVGAALLWTLKQELGPAFGPESEAAWSRVYAVLVEAMRSADDAEAGGGEAPGDPSDA
jgi:hemoglobin-like flavoprotein